MRIDCLMGTYGRHGLASEALACFLAQSALSNATLLIYNQHPQELNFTHPRVRVVNEQCGPQPLRYIKQRMVELADPSADFIHWWDDDDLCLPWHLEDCLENIGTKMAWKPATAWFSERNTTFSRIANRLEPSWLLRAEYVRHAPIDTHPLYTDHPVMMQIEEAGLLATTDLGGRTSYIYRWDTGTQHISGYGGEASEAEQAHNIQRWREFSTDLTMGRDLVAADLTERWSQYLAGIAGQVSADDLAHNRSRLAAAFVERPLL